MADKPKQRTSIYQLKVTLSEIRPPIWRRIQVPGEITLRALHGVLQVAMGWESCHFHEFEREEIRYGRPDKEYAPEVRDDTKARLAEVAPDKGMAITYLYDFGDGWRHEILVEEILPADQGVAHAVCLAGERACPPEDVGGPWGYAHYLEAIADPDHPEHDELLDWRGEFDLEAFDVVRVNRELKRAGTR